MCDPVTYFECDVKISEEFVYPFQSYETLNELGWSLLNQR